MTNTANGEYSLGKSKNTFAQIWDLIEAQLDQQLKSTKGDTEVQLIYPLVSDTEAVVRCFLFLSFWGWGGGCGVCSLVEVDSCLETLSLANCVHRFPVPTEGRKHKKKPLFSVLKTKMFTLCCFWYDVT